MVDHNDINSIDTSYFEILERKEFGVVLRSRCTGHYWYLLEQMYNGHRTFQIHHKHNAKSSYHIQRNKPSVAACCDYIRDHDTFQLRKIQEKRERRLKRFI